MRFLTVLYITKKINLKKLYILKLFRTILKSRSRY